MYDSNTESSKSSIWVPFVSALLGAAIGATGAITASYHIASEQGTVVQQQSIEHRSDSRRDATVAFLTAVSHSRQANNTWENDIIAGDESALAADALAANVAYNEFRGAEGGVVITSNNAVVVALDEVDKYLQNWYIALTAADPAQFDRDAVIAITNDFENARNSFYTTVSQNLNRD